LLRRTTTGARICQRRRPQKKHPKKRNYTRDGEGESPEWFRKYAEAVDARFKKIEDQLGANERPETTGREAEPSFSTGDRRPPIRTLRELNQRNAEAWRPPINSLAELNRRNSGFYSRPLKGG